MEAVRAREALLRKGDASDHLLVVGRGCVKVVASTSRGYEAVLAIRGTGDLLGEQAAFDGSPRSASVLALTSTRALLLPLSDFDALCRTEAAVARALRHTQSDRLRQADRRRVAAGAEGTGERLAALLLDLGERYGSRCVDGGLLVGLPLSQDDLAGLVLASRRSVSRVLEQWRGRGWVTTGRNRLIIEDPDALKREAGTALE